jgi:hypothetical protein
LRLAQHETESTGHAHNATATNLSEDRATPGHAKLSAVERFKDAPKFDEPDPAEGGATAWRSMLPS